MSITVISSRSSDKRSLVAVFGLKSLFCYSTVSLLFRLIGRMRPALLGFSDWIRNATRIEERMPGQKSFRWRNFAERFKLEQTDLFKPRTIVVVEVTPFCVWISRVGCLLWRHRFWTREEMFEEGSPSNSAVSLVDQFFGDMDLVMRYQFCNRLLLVWLH